MTSTLEFKSAMVEKGRLLPGIHGLRGIAAMAVVLFHLIGLAGIAPPAFLGFIRRDFGFSVQLFFVLSAFSLCYSTESRTSRENWILEFYIKRFFRIAPLFYFMIALEIARQVIVAGRVVTDLNRILLNVTFSFGFVPNAGLVWGGWTVGVEMIFYAIFPLLLLTIRTHRSALVLLVASIVFSYLVRSELHAQYFYQNKRNWSEIAFESNLVFFSIGIYAYHVSRHYRGSRLLNLTIPFLSLAVIGALMFLGLGQYFIGSGRWDIVIWGFGFFGLCVWQSSSPSPIIANRLFEYLGERSYSIYLLHPVIIFYSKGVLIQTYEYLQPTFKSSAFLFCAILCVALVLFFAEFTYRIIEVPGIRFGQKFIAHGKRA